MSSHLYAGLTVAAAMLHTVFGNAPVPAVAPSAPADQQVYLDTAFVAPTWSELPAPAPGSSGDAIAQQAHAGVVQIDRSMRELPALGAAVATRVSEQGLAGFLQKDEAYSRQAERVGRDLGQGIGKLALALGSDMAATAQKAGR